MKRALMVLIAVVSTGCVGPFSELVEHQYPNKAATAEDRGWLPDILPEDAVDIREVHDIDSNRTWGCFNTRDLGSVRAALSKLGATKAVGPIHRGPREVFRDFSWWPESMASSSIETMEFREASPYAAAPRGGSLIRVGIDTTADTICFYRSVA